MAKRRSMNVNEALEFFYAMDEEQSDGGEISGLSDVSWNGSQESSSESLSDDRPPPDPPRKGKQSRPDLPTPLAEVSAPKPQEIDKDGIIWTIEGSGGTGRYQSQNVLTESAGPTPHASRNVGGKLSAFLCLFDNVMLCHIRGCTVAEAHRVSGQNTWGVSLEELRAFIALLFVRGAYCGKSLDMESFWSEQWGNAFFTTTLSRNRFREIMRYLRFDRKET
ncbi:uncharacterized protein V6R79_003345 [Siganus canaliculatus]